MNRRSFTALAAAFLASLLVPRWLGRDGELTVKKLDLPSEAVWRPPAGSIDSMISETHTEPDERWLKGCPVPSSTRTFVTPEGTWEKILTRVKYLVGRGEGDSHVMVATFSYEDEGNEWAMPLSS